MFICIISDTTDGRNDYLLVTVKWNKRNSVLMVIPDIAAFNTSGYKVDIDKSNDTRFVYRYWLINISPTKEETLHDKKENFVQEVVFCLNLISYRREVY